MAWAEAWLLGDFEGETSPRSVWKVEETYKGLTLVDNENYLLVVALRTAEHLGEAWYDYRHLKKSEESDPRVEKAFEEMLGQVETNLEHVNLQFFRLVLEERSCVP